VLGGLADPVISVVLGPVLIIVSVAVVVLPAAVLCDLKRATERHVNTTLN